MFVIYIWLVSFLVVIILWGILSTLGQIRDALNRISGNTTFSKN
jgi:hypothetical protein